MYKKIFYCLAACVMSIILISWMYTKQTIKTHPRSTNQQPEPEKPNISGKKGIEIKTPKCSPKCIQFKKPKVPPKNIIPPNNTPKSIPGYQKIITKADIECLAVTVYYEALHESNEGKRAIVYAVLNRSFATKYNYGKTNSIYDIITAPKQFSWVHGNFRRAKRLASETDTNPGWQQWIPLVLKVLNNYHIKNSPIKDATHFVNINEATEEYKWWESNKMRVIKKIGSHTFLKPKDAIINMPGNQV